MKKNTFKNVIIYFFLIFVMTSVISVGYAALQINLTVTGTVNTKKDNMLVNNTNKNYFLDCTNIPSSSVTSLNFLRTRPTGYADYVACDVSAAQDHSIMAYQFSATGSVAVVSNGIMFSNTRTKFRALVNCSSIDFADQTVFNTRNLENMNRMFDSLCSNSSCSMSELNLSSFDTSKVTAMVSTFNNASNVQSINFGSYYDTSNVTDMGGMFSNCSSLSSLDLTSFDTSLVVNMSLMFSEATSLQNIYVDSVKWNISNIGSCNDGTSCSGDSMFYMTQLSSQYDPDLACTAHSTEAINLAHIDTADNPGCLRSY